MLDLSGPNPWRTITSSVVFDDGRLRVREDAVVQPDGAPGTYSYVEGRWPVVAAVPLTHDGQVHLVRQWRYPWRRNSWEIPAGHCQPDEDPLHAAQRELAEEVGLQAARWQLLHQGFGSATVSTRIWLYLARDLAPAPAGHAREGSEADMVTRAVPLAQAVAAATDGTIVHPYTIIGLLHVARLTGS